MPVGKILYQSLQWKSLQFFTSFLVNIIFARALRSAAAGEFYQLVYLLSLFISFFTLGLDISFSYFLSRKEMEGEKARRIILGVTAIALLVTLLLLYGSPVRRFRDLGMTRLLVLAGLQITGGLLTSLAGTLFTAAGKNYFPARVAFIANVLLAVISLYCSSQFSGLVLINVLLGLYFTFSFGQGLLLFLLSFRLPFDGADAIPLPLKLILRFSFFASATNFIFFIAARLCIYLLPSRVTLYDQGNYIQAYKLVEYLGLAMSFTYYPFIALVAEGKEKMRAHLLLLVRLSNTVILCVAVAALITGRWLFPFLFGPSFDRMYGTFSCLIPGLFAVCSSSFFTAWYFGHGQIRTNFISACIQLLSLPVLFFILIGAMGLAGAALAFSLSSLFSLVYDLWIFRRAFPYAAGDILLIRKADWKLLGSKVRFRINSS